MPQLVLKTLFILFLFNLSFPGISHAEKLEEIPSIELKIRKDSIKVTLLGKHEARQIETNGKTALISSGRELFIVSGSNGSTKLKPLRTKGPASRWHGAICAYQSGYLVAIQDYPEDQLARDSTSPRGSFRAGPAQSGLMLFTPPRGTKYLPAIKIASRPEVDPEYQTLIAENQEFSHLAQSCAAREKNIFLASYGSLGILNLQNNNIALLEEDLELAFNRSPLLVEKDKLVFGKDEGGMGGAVLAIRAENGKARYYTINTDDEYEIVSFEALTRHQGKLFAGTSHGLFMLDEKTGKFTKMNLGEHFPSSKVNSLISHGNQLWVFADGNFLRIDLEKKRGTILATNPAINFHLGMPFGDDWILAGEESIWLYRTK